MPTDYQIRRMHVIDGWSKETIADMLGHSADSIRGRVSRADLADRVKIIQELAEKQPLKNLGVEKQHDIIRRSERAFALKQEELKARGTMATAIFVSDLHVPYLNYPALQLMLEIVAEIKPDYYSAFNDFFDFEGYSSWDDNRPPAARLWSDDIWNAIAVAREIHAALDRVAPEMTKLQVQGNHDNWMYHHIRSTSKNGFSEHSIATFMWEMEQQGILQFSNGANKQENIVQLSPGLKWVHGVGASKSPLAVAKSVQDACAGREDTGDEGTYYYTVSGHTHRPFELPINGVKHWNSGTLGTHDPHYMKHRPHWGTAIVINRFDPNSRFTVGEVVEFKRRGGHLVARYDGVDFDVPLTSE
jgi:hypothetical protein